MPSQKGRRVVVTGANTGIGFETARVLALRGADVVLACRDPARGEGAVARIRREQPGASVRFSHLDLASLASVRAFARALGEGGRRLDLLVNNAGVMLPAPGQTAEGFELHLGINHLGHFALTGLLHELLLATPGSRVVVVASLAHRLGVMHLDDPHLRRRRYSGWHAYCQSKLANLLFVHELQRRLDAAGAGTLAVAAHPGWTATDLLSRSRLVRCVNPLLAQPAALGARSTLMAAVADEVRGGQYFGPSGVLELRGPPREVRASAAARDPATARAFWELSEQLTGVRFLPSA